MFIIQKTNGKLIYKDLGGYETRNGSTFWCLEQADKQYKWQDFRSIIIFTGDAESDTNKYSYSKSNSLENLVPDFVFHSWPQVGIMNYADTVESISKAGLKRATKHKVGWIGNINTNGKRKILFNMGENNTDILEIFNSGFWVPEHNKIQKKTTHVFMSLTELVETYSVLIDIEGVGYSGRLKCLLWSNRPVLLVDRPHKEYFYAYLKEWVHYIPVKNDLSDLVEKTVWCLDNYGEAKEIANNAMQFCKTYLTQQACFSQWDKIITNIGSKLEPPYLKRILTSPKLNTIVFIVPISQPEYALRHAYYKLMVHPTSENNNDYKYTIIPALNGNPEAVSFESTNYKKYYLCPKPDNILYISKDIESNDDASWLCKQSENRFMLYCQSKDSRYKGKILTMGIHCVTLQSKTVENELLQEFYLCS